MLITQDAENKTRNLKLGGVLDSGDGEDYVIGRSSRSRSRPKVAEHTAVDRTKRESCEKS